MTMNTSAMARGRRIVREQSRQTYSGETHCLPGSLLRFRRGSLHLHVLIFDMIELALENAFSSSHNIFILFQSSTRLRPCGALEV
jgi:hypothetical protein